MLYCKESSLKKGGNRKKRKQSDKKKNRKTRLRQERELVPESNFSHENGLKSVQ